MGTLQRVERIRQTELLPPAEAYDTAAASYDSWHWQKVWRAVEGDFGKIPLRARHGAVRVLDVGCGTGTLLGGLYKSALPKKSELVGVDISRGMLARAREKFRNTSIKFIHADFLSSSFQGEKFDIVFMCRVASHIEDLDLALRKVALLLSSGGEFVFSDVYSEHQYECTKLPHSGGKIPVVTFKHSISKIINTANKYSMVVTGLKTCSVDDLPHELQSDPELPRVLAEQLDGGLSMPFGCVITFSLRD